MLVVLPPPSSRLFIDEELSETPLAKIKVSLGITMNQLAASIPATNRANSAVKL